MTYHKILWPFANLFIPSLTSPYILISQNFHVSTILWESCFRLHFLPLLLYDSREIKYNTDTRKGAAQPKNGRLI